MPGARVALSRRKQGFESPRERQWSQQVNWELQTPSVEFGKILGSKRWRTTAIDYARDAESGYYSNVNSASEIVRRRIVTSGPANTFDLRNRISVSRLSEGFGRGIRVALAGGGSLLLSCRRREGAACIVAKAPSGGLLAFLGSW